MSAIPLAPPGGDSGTYATVTGTGTGKTKRKKMKLNILDIFLERRDTRINFNLSKEELAKLLFSKMKINPGDILKIDTAGFGKIQIELKTHVKPEKFENLPVFTVSDGLSTKFYKPHHRKESLVTVSWLDLETSDEDLLHL